MNNFYERFKNGTATAVAQNCDVVALTPEVADGVVKHVDSLLGALKSYEELSEAWFAVYELISKGGRQNVNQTGRDWVLGEIQNAFTENTQLHDAHEMLAAHLDDANKKVDTLTELGNEMASQAVYVVADNIRLNKRIAELEASQVKVTASSTGNDAAADTCSDKPRADVRAGEAMQAVFAEASSNKIIVEISVTDDNIIVSTPSVVRVAGNLR